MSKDTLLVQDAFFDASAPLQKGQIADYASHNLMVTGGGGDYPVQGTVYIGEFVAKGDAVTWPDDQTFQRNAVVEPTGATVTADLVGIIPLDCSAISDPVLDRPGLIGPDSVTDLGQGKSMTRVAQVGSGIVVGFVLGEGTAADGGAVYTVVDAGAASLPVGTISATSGAGKIDTGSTFFGATATGAVGRIKL